MNNDIISPAEWLAALGDTQPETCTGESFTEELLREYAGHVAARVARNVRHRACDIVGEFGPEMGIIQDIIMNIQIRDVYPAGEEA